MPTYRIVRFFQDKDKKDVIIARGLTLEEAQEHCSNPKTSSRTAQESAALARTKQYGRWFDGFTSE